MKGGGVSGLKGIAVGTLVVGLQACGLGGPAGDEVALDDAELRASNDIAVAWNSKGIAYATTSGLRIGTSYRAMALAHIAAHDAINSIRPRYKTYLPRQSGSSSANLEAAAGSAVAGVMSRLAPHRAAEIGADLTSSLAGIAAGRSKDAGIAVGDAAAAAILAARANDGWFNDVPYTPSGLVGRWAPTPDSFAPAILAYLPQVQALVLHSASQFRPAGPPGLTSAQYAADLNEVKVLGIANSTARAPEQTETGRFMFESEIASLNRLARTLADQENQDLHQTARMFALLNIAVTDSLAAVFEAKYFYDFWRPSTAIRNADLDGNPETSPDLSWHCDGWTGGPGGRFITPAFPEYPSAHAGDGYAGVQILIRLFGDRTPIAVTSTSLPGFTRRYGRLSDYGRDYGNSRIFVGYHYRFSVDDGREQGKAVANYVFDNTLRPVGDPDSHP